MKWRLGRRRRWGGCLLAVALAGLVVAGGWPGQAQAIGRHQGPVWVGAALPPAVVAGHVAILDAESGTMLYEKAGEDEIPVASLTKIVTAIVALEQGNLDDEVTVDFDPSRLRNSTLMGIQPGDVLTLEDLLYGLMLPAGNDAALAIANYIAGSTAAFADRMNAKVAELGLTHSHFVNPHGLDQPDHYSSVVDLVYVARYAMANPAFRRLAAARSWTVHTQRGDWMVQNLNQMLGRYPGTEGIKIGYVRRSQRTLVASVQRDGHRVILALTNTNDYVADASPLYDWVFRNFSWEPAEGD